MREVQGPARSGLQRGDRRAGIAGDAKIVAVEMQRVGHAERGHRILQRQHDPARRHAVGRHDIVEREGAPVVLEGRRAAGVDAFDAEAAPGREHRGHVVAHEFGALAAAEGVEEEIIVAEDQQDAGVDDRDVGEFQVGMQRGERRYGGLDDGGVAHGGVKPAGLVGGKRRCAAPLQLAVEPGAALLGQHQPRGVHVVAGDVGVDVDGAGHYDLVGHIIGRVGPAGLGGRDDPITG
jgi:hypothetical protein